MGQSQSRRNEIRWDAAAPPEVIASAAILLAWQDRRNRDGATVANGAFDERLINEAVARMEAANAVLAGTAAAPVANQDPMGLPAPPAPVPVTRIEYTVDWGVEVFNAVRSGGRIRRADGTMTTLYQIANLEDEELRSCFPLTIEPVAIEAMRPEDQMAVGYVADYEAGGNPHQGPFATCAIYSFVNALNRTVLARRYGIHFDVVAVPATIASWALLNEQGSPIRVGGVTFPWFFDRVKEKMNTTELQLEGVHGHPLRYAKILDMQHRRRTLTEFWEEVDAADLAYGRPRRECVVAPTGMVVLAGGHGGPHCNHFLTVVALARTAVVTENSHGTTNPNPVIPGDEWPRLLALWEINISSMAVQDQASAQDGWRHLVL